jgi:hypothetical protein
MGSVAVRGRVSHERARKSQERQGLDAGVGGDVALCFSSWTGTPFLEERRGERTARMAARRPASRGR